ncbi:ATP-dependent DNA helicase [Trichonephila inaurata madagascariensis]|uniref:ATP-dependent DNA helicase n=1 Tax=Trichonephila inaurata madagascariensis TaxID=2747483 RepID=A0A8X6YB98_9ARAC|nr:ATP-dependent DNA helicase [Trichonephila inaurata madagascariensis]
MVGKKLHDFGMISSLRVNGNDFNNEMARELGYDFIALQCQVISQLTPEQSHVFHQVLRKIESGSGALFIFRRPWGNRKNVFIKLINVSQKKPEESIVCCGFCRYSRDTADRRSYCTFRFKIILESCT